jgi:polar amino acid transport system permease protein
MKETLEKILSWIPPLLMGARLTIGLTVTSVSAGVILGLFLAMGKMSKQPLISKSCGAYIFFFRGTPLLMQLYFIYYALPRIMPIFNVRTGSQFFDRFIPAFIAFALNAGAYSAEIIRAAIQSIDKGQFEASRALGLTYPQTMRLVVIPQAIRRLIPPIGNEFIIVLQDASLVSMIALTDIMQATRTIAGSTGSALVYLPAMALYLVITAVFNFVFHKTEKKYSVYE